LGLPVAATGFTRPEAKNRDGEPRVASRIRFLALAALVALVAACAYGPGSTPETRAAQAEANAAQAREQSIQNAMGNMTTQSYEPGLGTGGIFDLFGPGRAEPARQIGVNKYLWTASLDVLSFLPLEGADPFSGVIVTDWGRVGGDPTPFRVTVLISEAALDARSLRVAALRQQGGRPVPVSTADNRRLEDAILTRARQLRIASAER
jgi:hypothetical protein